MPVLPSGRGREVISRRVPAFGGLSARTRDDPRLGRDLLRHLVRVLVGLPCAHGTGGEAAVRYGHHDEVVWMSVPMLISDPGQVTADWLTAVLVHAEVLPHGAVAGFQV